MGQPHEDWVAGLQRQHAVAGEPTGKVRGKRRRDVLEHVDHRAGSGARPKVPWVGQEPMQRRLDEVRGERQGPTIEAQWKTWNQPPRHPRQQANRGQRCVDAAWRADEDGATNALFGERAEREGRIEQHSAHGVAHVVEGRRSGELADAFDGFGQIVLGHRLEAQP